MGTLHFIKAWALHALSFTCVLSRVVASPQFIHTHPFKSSQVQSNHPTIPSRLSSKQVELWVHLQMLGGVDDRRPSTLQRASTA